MKKNSGMHDISKTNELQNFGETRRNNSPSTLLSFLENCAKSFLTIFSISLAAFTFSIQSIKDGSSPNDPFAIFCADSIKSYKMQHSFEINL